MNILCMMSGGATQVINAALAGLLSEAKGKHTVYAVINGIDGIMTSDIKELEYSDTLKNTPGCYIGTSRVGKLTEDHYYKLQTIIKAFDIKVLVNIGGNGTIKQSQDIKKHFKDLHVIVIPKTVDNDLGDKEYSELLYTPGFPSILEFWNQKLFILNTENRGAFTHDRVLIAQTFGRDTGQIVGGVRYFDRKRKLPLMILLPEDIQDIQKIINRIQIMRRVIIIINESYFEGIFAARKDKADQTMYGSSENTSCQVLCNLLAKEGIQSRIYNPTVEQRQSMTGIPKFDTEYSFLLGKIAIKTIKDYESCFITIDKNFSIYPIELDKIKDYTRKMKEAWIDKGNFDVTDKYLDYIDSIYNNIYKDYGYYNKILKMDNK